MAKTGIKSVAELTAESAILGYWNEINSGGVNVGKWIRLLYEIIIQGLDEKRWFYDRRLAENAVRFIQRYCHHYKGKLAPQRIRLELWELSAVELIFGIVDGEGKRQFTQQYERTGDGRRQCGIMQRKAQHARHAPDAQRRRMKAGCDC